MRPVTAVDRTLRTVARAVTHFVRWADHHARAEVDLGERPATLTMYSSSARLPPGQYADAGFPVLTAGPAPQLDPDDWGFRIDGMVAQEREWTWAEFRELPFEKVPCDIHCVTKWSKLGTSFGGQAALFPAGHGSHVDLLVRGPDLAARMSRCLVDQVDAHPAIDVQLGAEARELHGSDSLEAVDGTDRIETRALFVFIGADASTEWLGTALVTDQKRFLVTVADLRLTHLDRARDGRDRQPFPLETSRPGVFAAGDVRAGSIKRVASAAGEGAMAVRMIHQYLALFDSAR